jgi:hypothetical protein
MSDYHDATLRTLLIDWEGGIITITFELCSESPQTAKIIMTGIREFSSTRRFPWGESFFVNNLIRRDENYGQQLQIEMQSGDLIIVKGEEVLES